MKRKKIVAPIILGALCAISVHGILFTNMGHRLQSAIIESNAVNQAESRLLISDKKLHLITEVEATNVMSVEATINYDDSGVQLGNPDTSGGSLKTSDTDFTKKIVLTFPAPTTLQKGQELISWEITKKTPEEQSINLSEVAISMTDGNRLLSTEGTGEF